MLIRRRRSLNIQLNDAAIALQDLIVGRYEYVSSSRFGVERTAWNKVDSVLLNSPTWNMLAPIREARALYEVR